MSNILELSMMKGDAFNGIKSDFDKVFRKTLGNMEKQESHYAEITVKVKISLEEEEVTDYTVTTHKAYRNVIVPKFEHKISSVLQIKDEVTGALKGRYELIWDKERGQYVMCEISDGQTSIFDDYIHVDAQDVNSDGTIIDVETEALPGRNVAGLLPDYSGDDNEAESSDPFAESRAYCIELFPDCICTKCKLYTHYPPASNEEACCDIHYEGLCDSNSSCDDFVPIDTIETDDTEVGGDNYEDDYEYQEPEDFEGGDE